MRLERGLALIYSLRAWLPPEAATRLQRHSVLSEYSYPLAEGGRVYKALCQALIVRFETVVAPR